MGIAPVNCERHAGQRESGPCHNCWRQAAFEKSLPTARQVGVLTM
jgi:hypothetical protein